MISLAQARRDNEPFGTSFKVHSIGKRYDVVEYMTKPAGNSPPDFVSEPTFASYVDGRRTSCAWPSLEVALIHCFALGGGMEINCARHVVKPVTLALELEY